MNWSGWILVVAQTWLFIAMTPLFAGWIKSNKALLQNRKPPSVFQPYRDLRKLLSKHVLLANSCSSIFRVAPYIVLVSTIMAASIIPFIVVGLPVNAMADAMVLVGLLALGRFFLALAGMDVGTPFGGMGASREMMVSSLAEPAMLMVIFTLAMVSSSTNLSTLVIYSLDGSMELRPSVLFALMALVMVALAETGRIPIDNTATHLELTMIHEAMILEYSGRHLAMMELAAQIKLLMYAALIISLFAPWGISQTQNPAELMMSAVFLVGKLAVIGSLLAMGETALAKMRVFRAPTYLAIAFTVALVGMLSFVILEGG